MIQLDDFAINIVFKRNAIVDVRRRRRPRRREMIFLNISETTNANSFKV